MNCYCKKMTAMKKSPLSTLLVLFFVAVFVVGCSSAKDDESSLSSSKNNNQLKIAAFNIQVFGTKKAANPEIMKYIVKIIQKYDLILIQEIRDKSQTAMLHLLRALERANTPYKMHISERLGRTNSKEQYAFLYSVSSGIQVKDSFTYDDGAEGDGTDTFEREPFVVRIYWPKLPFKYLSLIAVHVDPDSAVAEIKHLMDVYKETVRRWKSEEVIILGDMNADCGYLPKRNMSSIPLRADSYYWPIEDEDDTTIAKSNCAYDRFIMAGDKLIELAKRGKASVFKFDEAYGLNESMAKLISDHYPIELTLPTGKDDVISSSSKSEHSGNNVLPPLISQHWTKCVWAIFHLLKDTFRLLGLFG